MTAADVLMLWLVLVLRLAIVAGAAYSDSSMDEAATEADKPRSRRDYD